VGPAAAGGKIRVLLADDHAIVRQGLARIVNEEPDMEVVAEAVDGRQAIDLARQLSPDVIVMDTGMPVLNGLEATREITAAFPQSRVIGLSMFDEAAAGEAMRQAGAVAYLSKGGPSQDLLSAIRSAAGRGHHDD
jgi:DNA-binding NarL/FixJ family response regulator